MDDDVTRCFGSGEAAGPPELHSMGLRANVELSIMKIDLNWGLWLLNGWHWGIFFSRELGSQYGTYKRPINNVRPEYKTFTDWVNALYSASSAPRYGWEYCEKNDLHLLEYGMKLSSIRLAFSTVVPSPYWPNCVGVPNFCSLKCCGRGGRGDHCAPTSSLMLEWLDHRMIMSELQR